MRHPALVCLLVFGQTFANSHPLFPAMGENALVPMRSEKRLPSWGIPYRGNCSSLHSKWSELT